MGGDHGGHGHGHVNALASEAEMVAARVPLEWRDFCAGLLIPLNACRRDALFMPWACKHERHAYELCQYKQYTARLKKPEGGSQQHAATAAPAHH